MHRTARRSHASAGFGILAALLLSLPAMAQIGDPGPSRGLLPTDNSRLRPQPGEGDAGGIYTGDTRGGGRSGFGRRDFAWAVPEPGAAALFGLGLAALIARQRRQQRRR